ncbi:MAG: hypothetical protein KatS3mg131_3037 [Candidatus Tectimicrobiota bacterium]|nr:MAG: hypothetical protein KatS3mg131_3037 [Candidatus Tectomicrobia bacterium]
MANRAQDWLQQAQHDLAHARRAVQSGDYDGACFAAQQAAEKALIYSRFIDREAVRAALQQCALRLKASQPAVRAAYLFGSFVTNTATPRSDADIAVEIAPAGQACRQAVAETARTIFLAAPVAVDLFVLSTPQLAAPHGLAAAIRQQGLRPA